MSHEDFLRKKLEEAKAYIKVLEDLSANADKLLSDYKELVARQQLQIESLTQKQVA